MQGKVFQNKTHNEQLGEAHGDSPEMSGSFKKLYVAHKMLRTFCIATIFVKNKINNLTNI